ncbi:hypothetical protein M2436_000920 [Streptomyces sp. HB372]|nr:hypothetical protein [Streptomyces sp. HB372]
MTRQSGQGLSRRVGGAAGEGEGALRVDHHALGLGPEGGGQDDIGVRVGLGVGEHVLGDDEFGGLQALDDGPAVAYRGDRVGADDPAGLDLPLGHAPEHVDGAAARAVRAQGAGRDAPQLLGEGAFLVDQDRSLAGQSGAHVAHLASAHGVGLAGERERSAAGAADRSGRQVQVDDRVGVPGAVGGLVEAHRPAAHPGARLADPAGRLPDVVLGDAGDRGHGGGRVVAEEGGHRLPALGVLGDEPGVGVPVLDEEVQQPVEEGQVGAGPDPEVQVGLGGGGVAPGVDDDQLRARLDALHHPQEEDRVAVGHVGAGDEEDVGVGEVLVGPGRPVRAEGQLVAAARARHAEPGVGLDGVRPDEALGQFVGEVLRLQRHLAGDVEGHRVRAVGVQHGPQPARRLRDGGVPAERGGLLAAVGAGQGGGQPSGGGEEVRAGRALGAQPAGVRRVLLVPRGLHDGAAAVGAGGDVEDDPAADTAVRADRAHPVGDGSFRRRGRHGHGGPSGAGVPGGTRAVGGHPQH